MQNKKHVHELDELDSIANELETMDIDDIEKKTRLQNIAHLIKKINNCIFIFYKKTIKKII